MHCTSPALVQWNTKILHAVEALAYVNFSEYDHPVQVLWIFSLQLFSNKQKVYQFSYFYSSFNMAETQCIETESSEFLVSKSKFQFLNSRCIWCIYALVYLNKLLLTLFYKCFLHKDVKIKMEQIRASPTRQKKKKQVPNNITSHGKLCQIKKCLHNNTVGSLLVPENSFTR